MATTITVDESTLKRFKDERPDDTNSADEFVNILLDVYDGEFDYDTEALFERLSALEDTAGANNIQREMLREELHEITEQLDGGVDEAALGEAVADYLVNGENLPERVAEELHR
jgi:hypothetical protein